MWIPQLVHLITALISHISGRQLGLSQPRRLLKMQLVPKLPLRYICRVLLPSSLLLRLCLAWGALLKLLRGCVSWNSAGSQPQAHVFESSILSPNQVMDKKQCTLCFEQVKLVEFTVQRTASSWWSKYLCAPCYKRPLLRRTDDYFHFSSAVICLGSQ